MSEPQPIEMGGFPGIHAQAGGERRPFPLSLGSLLAQKMAEEDLCRAIVLMAPVPPGGVAVRPPAAALPFYLKAAPAIVSGRPHLPRRDVVKRVAFSKMPENKRQDLYQRMVPESGLVLRELALGVRARLGAAGSGHWRGWLDGLAPED